MQNALVQVVTPDLTGGRVPVGARGGEDPLPFPFPGRAGVLAGEGAGQIDESSTPGYVLLMLTLHSPEVTAKVGLDVGRKQAPPVTATLPRPHYELAGPEVEVLDPQLRAFEQAEAGAVEEHGHEPRRAIHPPEHDPHLGPGEDHRQPALGLGPHHAVQPG